MIVFKISMFLSCNICTCLRNLYNTAIFSVFVWILVYIYVLYTCFSLDILLQIYFDEVFVVLQAFFNILLMHGLFISVSQ